MRRREFFTVLGVAFAGPLSARAQQPTKIPTIGLLSFVGVQSPDLQSLLGPFRQGLRERGYVEGQNIVIEYRSADQKIERLAALAADLVRMKVDLIVAGNTAAARAARQTTATIPIVCFTMSDPIGQGLIASLAHPGGNVTGFSDLSPDLVPKCLALLRETVPRASRVAALFYPDAFSERTGAELLQGAADAARKLGLELRVARVKQPEDIDRAFSMMMTDRAEAVVVFPGPLTYIERRRIVDLTTQHRLPAVFWRREFVEVGGLLSYGIDYGDQFRRGAAYVDKILKGAQPGDLPVEQPSKFELVINLKTAKALGIAVPPTLLAQADEVIE